MENLNAVITGVGGYVPDYVLTNDEISKMVDTNDEWIMGRIGIKERRILHEEGLGTSYMARKAVKQLMQRTKTSPNDIDLVIVATTTPDYHFPSTASILCDKLGLNNAFAFDMQAVCSGFLYAMEAGANFIRSGKYKKVVIVGADKMSSVIDYTDRTTCPIFGDGAAAFMLEPTREDMGVMDAVLRTDGKGLPFLHIKAGGSVCAPSYYTLDNRMHYIYQEGRTVFKYAVANMADACEAVMERNHLAKEDTPCGERLLAPAPVAILFGISIHALLAESDRERSARLLVQLLFLSTLSLRRATHESLHGRGLLPISIHALLTESDAKLTQKFEIRSKFLSTLSLRRATANGAS